MFRYSECPICSNGNGNGYGTNFDNPRSPKSYLQSALGTQENEFLPDQYTNDSPTFASIHKRGRSRRSYDVVPRISALSKESGFQSSYSSTSSVCSGSKALKLPYGESAGVSLFIQTYPS